MHFLFDIGGTRTRLAVSRGLDEVGEKLIIDTPQDYDQAISIIKESAEKLLGGEKVISAAGGIASVLDKDKATLFRPPHLKQWQGKSLKKDLMEIFEANVYLENDTDMAGLGEAVCGAGKNERILAYITMSTGIGGSRIVDQKIDVYSFGFEPGHQIIDLDGTVCPECRAFEDPEGVGHWEALCSGAAIKRRFGQEPKDITDESIWSEIIDLICVGLNNTVVFWSPDIIVLGGGLLRSQFIDTGRIEDKLRTLISIFPEPPKIKKAELGDLSAVYGAMSYLKTLN